MQEQDLILSRVGPGQGWALDLGGGTGQLHKALPQLGYQYLNVDVAAAGSGAVMGDAHRLPIHSASVDLVVSVDSLEHFVDPVRAVREIARVLRPTGRVVVWVPFMHPFHSDDYWRYTPLGIRYLFDAAGLELTGLEAPRWAASVVERVIEAAFVRSGRSTTALRDAAGWLDTKLRRFQGESMSVAVAYLISARLAVPRSGAALDS